MHGGAGKGVAVVIDDEPDARALLETILVAAGFDVVTAGDGAEGLRAVRAHTPRLITLDLSMPGTDGFAVLREVRELSSAYVVIVSMRADEVDLLQGLGSGADGYVVKPVRPREFRARVEALLRRPRQLEQQAAGHLAGAAPATAPALPMPMQAAPAPLLPPVPAQAAPAPVLPPVPAQAAPAPVLPPVPVQAPPAPPAPTPLPPAPAPQAEAPAPPPAPEPAPAPEALEAPPSPAAGAPPPEPVRAGSWERFRGLALNRTTRELVVDGDRIELDADQFELLVSILGSGRRLRTRSDLSVVLTGLGEPGAGSSDLEPRHVDAVMASLLVTLGEDLEAPRWIESIPGVGYRRAQM
ncbi:response regulator [Nocardioides sp. SOB77]|uniref:Response regulator n=1 Tax=Nocardioides oceani TaxID=3058369 RepID=A0ABT8FK94_9ACTN|nr:response regulator [Nocardioides oceani]MDN4174567.1 response regulator [Nocardioides oceani]